MYVPNIKVGRYVADFAVKKLMAMDSTSVRDGNHYINPKTEYRRCKGIYPQTVCVTTDGYLEQVHTFALILKEDSSWSGMICLMPTKNPERTPWKPERGM